MNSLDKRRESDYNVILMILELPIALVSWISLIPAAFGSLALIVRIRFEEKILIERMDGYEEYRNLAGILGLLKKYGS